MKKQTPIVGLLFLLILSATADIHQDAQSAATLASTIHTIIQGAENASDEVKTSANQLNTSATSLRNAVQQHGVHAKSKDELWKVIRHQRNLEALLSVSPLRKHATLNTKMKGLQGKLNHIKQTLE